MTCTRTRLVLVALCTVAGCIAGSDGGETNPDTLAPLELTAGDDTADTDALEPLELTAGDDATDADVPEPLELTTGDDTAVADTAGDDITETADPVAGDPGGPTDVFEFPGSQPSDPFWTLSPVNEIVVETCATIRSVVSLKAVLAPNGTDPGFTTRVVPVQPNWPCIIVPGMVADARNTLRLEARLEDGTVMDLGERAFDAPPLPDSLPQITATGTSTIDGWIAMPLAEKFGKAGGMAVIVDPQRGGRIIWYHAMGAVSDYGLMFQPLPGGRFAEYRGPTDGIDIVSLRTTVIETWNSIPGWEFVDGHLGVFQDDGSAILNGHVGDCQVLARVTADRRIDFTYHTFCKDRGAGDTLGPHPNWAVLRPTGDVMVSLRNQNAVDLYSGRDGSRIWRFGGTSSDFKLVGTDQKFSTQHGANLTPEGTLLVFDNGTDRETPKSRILEYRLDETAFTATLVREIDPAFASYTPVGGSAQRLPNGHTLAGRFFSVAEVDENGADVWTMEATTSKGKPWFSYHAFPMDEVH